MSGTVEGFVVKIFNKSGTNSRGPWAADSLKIADPQGNEDPYFYQLGFRDDVNVPPKVQEGFYVRFDFEDKDDKSRTVVDGTLVKVKDAPKNEAPASSGGGSGTQQSIHYQNSRNLAVAVVEILLEKNALKIDNTKTAAGIANRFDQITGAIDSLTVKYFNDAETMRVLDNFSDIGDIDTGAQADLPEEVEEPTVTEDGDEPL